jgi:hypothetical protein
MEALYNLLKRMVVEGNGEEVLWWDIVGDQIRVFLSGGKEVRYVFAQILRD